MASIRELKERIDLHDLAEKLGLKRPGGRGNYCSPHHDDKSPSLSIFNDGKAWKDHSTEEGGDCVSFVRYVENIPDVPTAMRRLHELYGIPFDKVENPQQRRERTRIDFIADQCKADAKQAVAYLETRGVKPEIAELAIAKGALGFNTWTRPGAEPGTIGYGGNAVAFIVRDFATGETKAVDFRYIDPALNGGVKTQSQGEKAGFPWFMDKARLATATTVYVVESAINALCIESCGIKRSAAMAIRGTGNWKNIDWRFLLGKRVVLVLDADKPNERGERPGSKAAWGIYDELVGLNIAAQMVDQIDWYKNERNDAADIAKEDGTDALREALGKIEPWAIPGLVGRDSPGGLQRVYLPPHDFNIYWRFRCKEDFTTYVSKIEPATDETPEQLQFEDLCGFRIAAISRVTIASPTSTMTGEIDVQPDTVFAVSVQTARHGAQLVRRVFEDEKLHNVEQWKRLGPVFNQAKFLRLVNVLERNAHSGQRDAVNFVGLAWRNGRPIVNEGPDCYFREPDKQCPYHNLIFPGGPRSDARRVIEAYQSTFKDSAAALLLVWGLGAHLKAFTGFWPHMVMQADKGSGKSTLIKRLERSLGMTMFSGQSLQTEFRQLTTVSYTSHPVGWEELSARKQEVIDKAVAMLQECYQYTPTKRNSDMMPYLLCAPVLLAGEDVPVRSLMGKVVRTDLTGRKGDLLPENLPRFPVRQWLEYLAELTREGVLEQLTKTEAWCNERSRGAGRAVNDADPGSSRAVRNYAAVLTAWKLLCDFAGMDYRTGGFVEDVRAEMNQFIKETTADREPFVWILETLVSEIESHQFLHPYAIDVVDGEDCLILRPQHVMDHFGTTNRLREQWNGLPVKTGRVFKRQLQTAGLIVKDEMDRRIHKSRHAHLTALSLKKMAQYGVYLAVPEEERDGYARGAGYPAASNE